tara:strand:+ start:278 stop:679 length:402 start_codon:yes stop_codon:yes gene_type:complete
MISKIEQWTKIIESNESIYKKIFCYKYRGILYLNKEFFINSIYDFTQNINLSKEINKTKKVNLFTNRELSESYFYRGYALAKTNNVKKAIKDFDKALSKNNYFINYKFFKKLNGEAKDILETQLNLIKLFHFK